MTITWTERDASRGSWLHHWKTAPSHTVAGLQELYQQLLPTKVYHHRKTGTSGDADERCRMCGKTSESVGHILAGCSAIAQTQYLARHNNALKILFFEMLRPLDLITKTAPWYSQAQPKPMYENVRVVAYWDVPLFADTTHVKANRIDARIIDKERKEVKLLEMSCPWVENREEKAMEKTSKYGPLRWELQLRYPDYKVTQQSTSSSMSSEGILKTSPRQAASWKWI